MATNPSTELSPCDAAFVRWLVHYRSGLALDVDKDYLIAHRLAALAAQLGALGPADVVRLARAKHADTETCIVEALATHETSFFRDRTPFEALGRKVLPELLATRRRLRSLTIWSAAASTGQEAYSIAMLLLDGFPELDSWRVRIVGTDLSRAVVARATAGTYRQFDVNRGVSAARLARHFSNDGPEWSINDAVRALVTFRQLNLLDSWASLPRPDVVFLRNLLIYFDLPTKQRILSRLYDWLPADGVVFVGATESLTPLDARWQPVVCGRATFFRKMS